MILATRTHRLALMPFVFSFVVASSSSSRQDFYDFVHSRMIAQDIGDWDSVMLRIYR